jgi:hypothetical protein
MEVEEHDPAPAANVLPAEVAEKERLALSGLAENRQVLAALRFREICAETLYLGINHPRAEI